MIFEDLENLSRELVASSQSLEGHYDRQRKNILQFFYIAK
jgi:hypothetical protein